jgi:hypothetical protein
MTEDTNAGGEWITGFTGEPFQVDADGKPIPNKDPEPSDAPSSPADLAKTWETARGALEDTGDSGYVFGGPDDKDQADIWDKMDRGEFGTGAETTPADAEPVIE